jgi:hypothetical protein
MKISFVKFAGCAAGGTEKYLQSIAILVKKAGHEVDYYYTNAAPITSTSWVHPDNDPLCIKLLEDNGINLIKVNVGFRHHNTWHNTDFFEKFDENAYDYLITAGNGGSEYPYINLNKIPIIHTIHGHHVFNKANISKSVILCNWQANKWLLNGGDSNKLVIIPPIVNIPKEFSKLIKSNYGIPDSAFIFGMHQRNDSTIFSNFSLECFRKLEHENAYMFIMGGSDKHRDYVKDHNIKRVVFFDFSSNMNDIHSFLNSLDVYAHCRADGEVCSASIIEAMSHGLPVISCPGVNNGHKEQIDGCGFFCSSIDEYTQSMKFLMNDEQAYCEYSRKTLDKYNSVYHYDIVKNKILELLK